MKDLVNKIRKEVLDKGACDYAPDLLKNVSSIDNVIDIMLHPQCIEFCMENKYPTLPILRMYEKELKEKGVYISSCILEDVPKKILIFGGDVVIHLLSFEASEIYICGGSVHVICDENSFATVENWGGMVLKEGNVNVYNKV